jgi:hypothetical protein
MSSIESVFTPLERAVLAAICEKHPEDRVALKDQLSTAALRSRENTGAGFYTRFTVDRGSSAALKGPRLRYGPPLVKVEGLEHGMGFILWLEEGYAHQLEGYAFDESTTEMKFEKVEFEINPGHSESQI